MTCYYKEPAVSLLFLVLFCVGCGGDNEANRSNVSGKVIFCGKPVPEGLIYFEPDAARGNSGPQGFAQIVDGEYHTDKVGRGAVMGPLVVRISGFPKGGQGRGDKPGAPLFPQYETRVELSEDTKTLNFEIPNKRSSM